MSDIPARAPERDPQTVFKPAEAKGRASGRGRTPSGKAQAVRSSLTMVLPALR